MIQLTDNWPIIAEPTALGEDLVPYDWFLADSWAFSPAQFTEATFGIYGGVQFQPDITTGAPNYPVTINTRATGCQSYVMQVLLTGSMMSLYGINIGDKFLIGEGWHTLVITEPSVTFTLPAESGIFQVKNIVVTCPSVEEEGCKGGNFKQPILAECDFVTAQELMAALRDEWIADSSLVYEAPECVFDELSAMEAVNVSSDCVWTSEDLVISHPSSLGTDVVTNGNFASGTTGWSGIVGRASVVDGKLTYTAGAGGVVSQTNLIVGRYYQISVVLSSVSAGSVDFEFGSGNSVGTADFDGTFTFVGIATGTTFRIVPNSAFVGQIDDIVIQPFDVLEYVGIYDTEVIQPILSFTAFQNNVVLQRFSFGDTSVLKYRDCFRLGMYYPYNSSTDQTPPNQFSLSNNFEFIPSAENTLSFAGIQNDEGTAFGWEFTDVLTRTIFAPRIRLFSELSMPKYPGEVDSYQDSAGLKAITYAESRKALMLKITHSPEYVHDYLRLACRTDSFRITKPDDSSAFYFTNTEEYAPTWIRISNLAPVTLDVEIREQDLTKNMCN